MSEFGKDTNVPSRKGVFIPDITVEMLRNTSPEGVEDLLASGEMEDISLPSAQPDLSDYSDKLWRSAFERGKAEEKEERKTGHWIEFPNHYAYKCSECGRLIETVCGKNHVHRYYPYCHCGAAMIEEGAQK